MAPSCSSVIPASSWRESRKNGLDTSLRGYDENAPIRMLEPRRFQTDYLPTFIEKLRSLELRNATNRHYTINGDGCEIEGSIADVVILG